MNYTDAIIALKAGSVITRTCYNVKREYSINPSNENQFVINGNKKNSLSSSELDYLPIDLLEAQNDGVDDWVIVDA